MIVDRFVHGHSAYKNRGCRCEHCRAGVRLYQRERAARSAKLALPKHVSHGSWNAYCNYGCRCEACREAARAYQREWRAARKAVAS